MIIDNQHTALSNQHSGPEQAVYKRVISERERVHRTPVLHPKTETVRRCHTEAERSCSGRAQPRIEGTRRRVLASGGGENPSRREGARGGRRVGRGCARTVSLAGSILPA